MATPEVILALRERIGHDPLPLVGVTAVVFQGDEVLVGRRADNGAWQCVSGIVEPGEEPADAAVRECLEEAGVVAKATRIALVQRLPRVTYANADQVDYIDLVFRCDWISGDPHPADGELTEARWRRVDDLADVDESHRRKIALARSMDAPTSFSGG